MKNNNRDIIAKFLGDNDKSRLYAKTQSSKINEIIMRIISDGFNNIEEHEIEFNMLFAIFNDIVEYEISNAFKNNTYKEYLLECDFNEIEKKDKKGYIEEHINFIYKNKELYIDSICNLLKAQIKK